MKILKNSLLLLLIVFLLDCVMTYAASVTTIIVSYQIPRGEVVTTNYRTKPIDSFGKQTYTNTFTNTPLTSPCPDCVIKVIFESEPTSSGKVDSCSGLVKMDETVSCNNTGMWQPGKYRLKLERIGFTTVSTYTSGEWKFYPQP